MRRRDAGWRRPCTMPALNRRLQRCGAGGRGGRAALGHRIRADPPATDALHGAAAPRRRRHPMAVARGRRRRRTHLHGSRACGIRRGRVSTNTDTQASPSVKPGARPASCRPAAAGGSSCGTRPATQACHAAGRGTAAAAGRIAPQPAEPGGSDSGLSSSSSTTTAATGSMKEISSITSPPAVTQLRLQRHAGLFVDPEAIAVAQGVARLHRDHARVRPMQALALDVADLVELVGRRARAPGGRRAAGPGRAARPAPLRSGK